LQKEHSKRNTAKELSDSSGIKLNAGVNPEKKMITWSRDRTDQGRNQSAVTAFEMWRE